MLRKVAGQAKLEERFEKALEDIRALVGRAGEKAGKRSKQQRLATTEGTEELLNSYGLSSAPPVASPFTGDGITSGINPDAGILPAESITGVAEDRSGTTSIELSNPLSDNAGYQWRARAYDGERYGPWTATASFSVRLSGESVNAAIDFDPDTLSKKSKGNWVTVYIELPGSYHPSDIDITSLRLEGVPAEIWPYAIEDHDKNGTVDVAVKFRRSEVVKLLPTGDNVTVSMIKCYFCRKDRFSFAQICAIV